MMRVSCVTVCVRGCVHRRKLKRAVLAVLDWAEDEDDKGPGGVSCGRWF
jgi:hypothetical protein